MTCYSLDLWSRTTFVLQYPLTKGLLQSLNFSLPNPLTFGLQQPLTSALKQLLTFDLQYSFIFDLHYSMTLGKTKPLPLGLKIQKQLNVSHLF